MTDTHPSLSLDTWRQNGIGVLRNIFGLIRAVDAGFKWHPESNVAGGAEYCCLWSSGPPPKHSAAPTRRWAADIGAAIIYALVFTGLFFARSGLFLVLDRRAAPLLGKWNFIALGRLPQGLVW